MSNTAYACPFPPVVAMYMVSVPEECTPVTRTKWTYTVAPLTEESMRRILREELERLAKPKRRRKKKR